MQIQEIVGAIASGLYRVTDHAVEEAFDDVLTLDEILYSVVNGMIIESYPQDKPFPSCLIFGLNQAGEPIHSVWAYSEPTAVLVTVYRPDPDRWIEWQTRR